MIEESGTTVSGGSPGSGGKRAKTEDGWDKASSGGTETSFSPPEGGSLGGVIEDAMEEDEVEDGEIPLSAVRAGMGAVGAVS